jgi:hypothetical protein
LPRRVAAAFAQRFSECVAEPPVVGFELADALGGKLKPALQGRLGGALAVGDALLRTGTSLASEPFDVGTQVGLGVEPGARYLRFAGQSVEADRLSGRVEPAQRGGRSPAGSR